MTTQTTSPLSRQRSAASRSLLLVWQDPTDRRFVPVAELDHLVSGKYVFRYRDDVSSLKGFFPLDEFPDMSRDYISDSLPVFFVNRIMSQDRPSYDRYLHWLGLEAASAEDVPIEVLARTGGGRATDTFHVVDIPIREMDSFESRFFVSGIRHVDGADGAVRSVRPGDRLELRPEPENAANPNAVIIDVVTGVQLGWVPDWLCGEVADLIDTGWSIEVTAEQINLDAPAHTRVLCRLAAARTSPPTRL